MKFTNNIILFPKLSDNSHISHQKENVELKEIQCYINDVLDSISNIIFNKLEEIGFSPNNPEDIFTIKEGAFIIESIRSLMYSQHKQYHPLQKVVDEFFIPDKKEKGRLNITDHINVNFKEKV